MLIIHTAPSERDRGTGQRQRDTYEPIGLNLVYDGVFPLAGVVDLAEVEQESERKREREWKFILFKTWPRLKLGPCLYMYGRSPLIDYAIDVITKKVLELDS